MNFNLVFDDTKYTVERMTLEGKTIVYRAFEHLPYVMNPADDIQRLSIFVPEAFYEGKSINGYDLKTAPILMPNTVGGYMPGPERRPGILPFGDMKEINASFAGILHGCVIVSPGVRGRSMKNAKGQNIGVAPAAICDLKAAVRYLKANRDRIPGDVNKIISNGTSAGGALSALLGATGNHPDYVPFLEAMGAADEDDSIFAASCYCPITNLNYADMAYEWEFCGQNDYHRMLFAPPLPGETRPQITPVDSVMTEEQQAMSNELKPMFPDYLNSLALTDDKGNALTLDADGNGSFKEYVKSFVAAEAQHALDTGTDMTDMTWLTIRDGQVTDIDFEKYVQFRTRMKETPAFDNVAMGTPENELFGTKDIQYRHFTAYSAAHSKVNGQMADEKQIKMMNPMDYADDEKAGKAKHYRIRHGIVDRDTSLAISAMLTAKLRMAGVDTILSYAWGMPHAGDYDPDALMAWVDRICK